MQVSELKPAKNIDKAANRTLSLEQTSIQTGTCRHSWVW